MIDVPRIYDEVFIKTKINFFYILFLGWLIPHLKVVWELVI